MNKVIACVLVMMIVVASITTFAASVPSKTTQDMTEVVSIASDNGAMLPTDFAIQILEETESVDKALKQLADFVTGQGLAPVRFFEEAVQQAIASLLPEEADLDKYVINEFSPLIVENYREAYGSITATFRFASEYMDGQPLVALIGLVTGMDEQGNPVVEWTPIKAVVEGGLVKVDFPADLLQRLYGQEAMIAILSEASAA